ncbi:UDP-3-O-acyl-N-acetylglucosamine deacetylase [Psychrobacter sp. FDAARGOS_221]|uniref:UDP-3-O-acyl-N-acetylglucosamine deacetylase n=1 Tax=Psychrobacter sp. FDAARGOS_221 TaxID=1975705 RepID=UPI000BB53B49|nr:UDP-3-O-acyl-N-acetylglucosamine deacetylase [Psychrobacter sp. FDAARGOS_221]PNK60234.1 UDP-3-O-acyl-N-acetylglucosamine deacetylase [Psychrobacter sp. FDAARGOS_221]
MKQRTLKQPITVVGVGLHSGQDVTLTLEPRAVDSGIHFLRTDIDNAPLIAADAFLVTDTVMSSNLVVDGVKIGTVEHLLSALAGLGIDNLLIKVSDAEMPIMDGSSAQYVDLLLQAGIEEQDEPKRFMKIVKPVRVTEGDKWAQLEPHAGFSVQFEIDFDHPGIPKDTQRFNFEFSTKGYIEKVGKARTFGFMKDIEYLKSNNLALGGSLDNAIVLDDTQILNEEGLRYKDEFVRHKILDAIGDLYLAKYSLIGKFSAFKSGHALNNKLIRAVYEDPSAFEIVTNYDIDKIDIDYSL